MVVIFHWLESQSTVILRDNLRELLYSRSTPPYLHCDVQGVCFGTVFLQLSLSKATWPFKISLRSSFCVIVRVLSAYFSFCLGQLLCSFMPTHTWQGDSRWSWLKLTFGIIFSHVSPSSGTYPWSSACQRTKLTDILSLKQTVTKLNFASMTNTQASRTPNIVFYH